MSTRLAVHVTGLMTANVMKWRIPDLEQHALPALRNIWQPMSLLKAQQLMQVLQGIQLPLESIILISELFEFLPHGVERIQLSKIVLLLIAHADQVQPKSEVAVAVQKCVRHLSGSGCILISDMLILCHEVNNPIVWHALHSTVNSASLLIWDMGFATDAIPSPLAVSFFAMRTFFRVLVC